jgi:hypothetical protein
MMSGWLIPPPSEPGVERLASLLCRTAGCMPRWEADQLDGGRVGRTGPRAFRGVGAGCWDVASATAGLFSYAARSSKVPGRNALALSGTMSSSARRDSLPGNGAVLACRFDRPLATEMDDQRLAVERQRCGRCRRWPSAPPGASRRGCRWTGTSSTLAASTALRSHWFTRARRARGPLKAVGAPSR